MTKQLSDEDVRKEERDILDEKKWGNRAFVYMKNLYTGEAGHILTYEDRFRSPLTLRRMNEGIAEGNIPFESLDAMIRDGWVVD